MWVYVEYLKKVRTFRDKFPLNGGMTKLEIVQQKSDSPDDLVFGFFGRWKAGSLEKSRKNLLSSYICPMVTNKSKIFIIGIQGKVL